MPGSKRLNSLDGLRGVAALIVVVHHCFLVSPAFAAAYYGGQTGDSPLRQALIYSPLHLVWGGAEAVVVFFVLSGFVLARGIRSSSFDWFAYFPSRILRLYVPVAGAVALGFLLLLAPHAGGPDSPWLQRDASDYDLGSVLQDLTLVGGTSGVVSPLWSLRWEVIFSLLLPVIAYAARVIPAWLFGLICVALSAIGAGQESAAMQYLPIFGVGVALEGEWGRIERLVGGLSRVARGVLWGGMLPLVVVLLSMRWLLPTTLDHSTLVALAQAPIVLGAGLLVVMVAQCAPLSRLFSWRPIAWLGAISFSLYLVHEPFVLIMASVTGAARWTLLTAVPLALVVAWLFCRVVERPAHKLSRRVRERARAKRTVIVEDAPVAAAERGRELTHV
ncbi:acyltransferase [Microbacterium sp. KR10-403]|uniref:acyltransferase family protein n=1 Tax=Microbacterium sp. KR10-403 TaxID=3158581 RepID=UPI0032E3CAE1